jgi:hypothetical protein
MEYYGTEGVKDNQGICSVYFESFEGEGRGGKIFNLTCLVQFSEGKSRVVKSFQDPLFASLQIGVFRRGDEIISCKFYCNPKIIFRLI